MDREPNMRSYSSATQGIGNLANEFVQLFRLARRPVHDGVQWARNLHRTTKARILEQTGVSVQGLKGLDIGPGQQLGCLRCFSLECDMTGIDTDVLTLGSGPRDILGMLRHNGPRRVLKTLGRRALLVDARYTRELARQCNVAGFPNPRVLRMSATQMTFADGEFDFVYSHSVFEHIDDAEGALREVRRVLKPNGVAYISIHLYTSHSGSHDPKVLADGTPVPPLWPHLREAHAHTVRPNTYLNKLSLAEWRELFDKVLPGTRFVYDRQDDEIGDGLSTLRTQGELTSYTDEELMTVNVIGIWQKPAAAAS
jgi:SAM-dependent methyltransferase